MADNGGFDRDQGTTTSFSQLLFSDDVVLGLDMEHTFTNYSCFSSSLPFSSHEKPPKMLCFGNYGDNEKGEIMLYGGESITRTTPQKSDVTCNDSSSASSGNNSSANTKYSKSNRKRNGSGKEAVQCSSTITGTPAITQKTSKKTKAENSPSSSGHAKVRKEKLGERIAALQQLVSPFGKTDTASVLHEAMGYIRFLHDQVQVLCSPYLQHHLPDGGQNGGDEELRTDLKSRGLCLVPVASTVHAANSNGADFWSPAMGNYGSSSKQH
ncbi:transcription factor bHLH113-like [Mangifera indica]|uniref:transcription factor bHLH113-like n=1 Tax=Mangifera indica TaxID=29780 RepID=UPI001CFAFAE4|nr:transcription factor bHLH113-like [Mangifera indica]